MAHQNPVKTAFLSTNNVRMVQPAVGPNAPAIMKKWASAHFNDLQQFASVQGDMSESLAYANQQFLAWLSAAGRNRQDNIQFAGRGRAILHPQSKLYPKMYIEEGVEDYDVDDFRAHNAYFEQHVFRSNANFRYNNALLPWQCALQKRWYDRKHFADGLRDHRELEQPARAYNMAGAWGPNKWTSSDSKMYCWRGP